jgi:cyanate lyase
MVSHTDSRNSSIDTSTQLVVKDVFKVFPGRQRWQDKLLRRTSADFVAIADINLEIAANTFVSIIGPSGCGKSTLLNIIAGLTLPTSGTVFINGVEVTQPGPDRASLFYRQASASEDEASKLLQALDSSQDLVPELTSFPAKGLGPVVPTDPLIYRFYEIMQVYGMPMKEIIHEKFGDGIMSAIDFTLDIEKVEDPKGDRVKVTMNGKFLPYKKW